MFILVLPLDQVYLNELARVINFLWLLRIELLVRATDDSRITLNDSHSQDAVVFPLESVFPSDTDQKATDGNCTGCATTVNHDYILALNLFHFKAGIAAF